jgi:hypothetical protein
MRSAFRDRLIHGRKPGVNDLRERNREARSEPPVGGSTCCVLVRLWIDGVGRLGELPKQADTRLYP